MRLVHCPPSPIRFAAIGAIPRLRKIGTLAQIQYGSALHFPIAAPFIDMLFRPEEEHGFSIEHNVVPPVGRGNGEMGDTFIARNAILRDAQRHRVTATTA